MSSRVLVPVLASIALSYFYTQEWRYLSRGYDVTAGFEGGTPPDFKGPTTTHYHIEFPWQRKAALVALALLSIIVVVSLGIGPDFFPVPIGIALALSFTIVMSDLRRYGVYGSPSSWKALLILVALFIAWQLERRASVP